MASYPDNIYEPREKENRCGVVYDPTKKSVIFVEDVKKLDDEVVAIENELGTNPKGTFASVKAFLQYLLSKVKDYLSDLLDVEISNPQDGHVLTYEAATQKWKNKESTGGAKTFLDLTDTPSSYSGKGKYLLRVKQTEDGIEFEKVPLEMIENPSGARGDLLFWDGTKWVRLPAGQAGQYLKTLGVNNNPIWADLDVVPLSYEPSENLLASSDSEVSTSSTSFVKVKEIKVPACGKYRVYFEIRSLVSGIGVYGQIYRNGSAIGSLRITQSTGWTSFSENIGIIYPTDLIQLYIRVDSTLTTCYARNFRIKGSILKNFSVIL